MRFLAGGADAKPVFGRLARESIKVPSAATERLAGIARDEKIWLALGANELAGGTLYNSLLVFGPDGGLAVHHRKLMPTNHERLVWGLGDGQGLEAVETDLGRVGGLVCWENYMPLARFRDLLGISRRPAQLLLERFDADGLTRRVGDERVLRRAAVR